MKGLLRGGKAGKSSKLFTEGDNAQIGGESGKGETKRTVGFGFGGAE